MVTIRTERDGDAGGIRVVVAAAFPSDAEARLVDALRRGGRLPVSLVAVDGDRIVGHVAFSPVRTESGSTGVGLAPVAVAASHRRRGVGAALIEAGLEACREAGYAWVVVLGDPAYYGRFGFAAATASGLRDEYGGGAAFQVMALREGGVPVDGGLVRYAPEFGEV